MTHKVDKPVLRGASPLGNSVDEGAAASAIQRMFNDIAPRYDLLNHLLSLNIDRLWWSRAAKSFSPILECPESRILDLCSGTGDMSLALERRRTRLVPPARNSESKAAIIAADFSHSMLVRGMRKFSQKNIVSVEANALDLPFPDDCFDLVVSAFGFRNLANYHSGLQEIYRVLRPGGEFGLLDFNEPGGLFGRVYGLYFHRILPVIGSLIGGVKGPYSYLPASVEHFPHPSELLRTIHQFGFEDQSWEPFTGGIAGLFRGKKPAMHSSFARRGTVA